MQPRLENLRMAVSGNHDVLQALLMDEYPTLYRFITSRLPGAMRSTVSADDILQETFILAFRDIKRFQPDEDARFGAWVRQIAANRLSDAIRQFRRLKRGGDFKRKTQLSGNGENKLGDLLDELQDSLKTPSRIIARSEAVQAIQSAIENLPLDQRQALTLCYLQNLGLHETAQRMKKSTNAVRGLIHRGKKALRTQMCESIKWFSIKN